MGWAAQRRCWRAFLEFLESKTLPAIAILKECAKADPD